MKAENQYLAYRLAQGVLLTDHNPRPPFTVIGVSPDHEKRDELYGKDDTGDVEHGRTDWMRSVMPLILCIRSDSLEYALLPHMTLPSGNAKVSINWS